MDLIERKEGGYYDSFRTTNNYNTYFDGHQINCNVSASAVGNSGTNQASGESGNAQVSPSGSINADATGNTGSNSFEGSEPFNAQAGNDSWTGSAGRRQRQRWCRERGADGGAHHRLRADGGGQQPAERHGQRPEHQQ
ncbi:MAG: hypothetical protein U5L11_00725 [Arhodomonas sp.]|nr:hypothetical protein [Arhodomonas sp.]